MALRTAPLSSLPVTIDDQFHKHYFLQKDVHFNSNTSILPVVYHQSWQNCHIATRAFANLKSELHNTVNIADDFYEKLLCEGLNNIFFKKKKNLCFLFRLQNSVVYVCSRISYTFVYLLQIHTYIFLNGLIIIVNSLVIQILNVTLYKSRALCEIAELPT